MKKYVYFFLTWANDALNKKVSEDSSTLQIPYNLNNKMEKIN